MPYNRPTLYTRELAIKICHMLAQGKTVKAICRENEDFPHESTVRGWAEDNVDDFYTRYSRARNIGLDVMADEFLEIADTPLIGTKEKLLPNGKKEVMTGDMVEHRRLQLDARKWYLGKLAPKRYGERLLVDTDKKTDRLDEMLDALRGDARGAREQRYGTDELAI